MCQREHLTFAMPISSSGLLGSLRNPAATATKASLQTNSLSYSKCFTIVSILFMLYNIDEVCYNQIGTYGFEARREKERFIVVLSTLSSKCEN